jgi:peroxiredoxin
VGDPAPDFSWTVADNQSRHLRDVLEQASALIVFAPDDQVLQSLEREREALADLGVVPMAVIEGRSGAINARARRLGLHFLMIPDGRHVIGAQFDVVDPQLERSQPAWFVVDRHGLVRGQWHEGLPHQGWARIAASALALPVGDVSLPARNR